MSAILFCKNCHTIALRNGPGQIYCPKCSEQRDLERKRLWVRNHPPSDAQKERNHIHSIFRKEMAKEAGFISSTENASHIDWLDSESPDLIWLVRISVPFSYATSKNHIYTLRRNGHIALRKESKNAKMGITHAIRTAVRNIRVANNKLWIDILVQKPNHKGDAINVIDLVCDAIKEAIPLDDRWYSIRRLDWEVVKSNPKLFIGIGQSSSIDCQVCSYCGQIKSLDSFNKNKLNKLGVGRECKECRQQGRHLAKEKRSQ